MLFVCWNDYLDCSGRLDAANAAEAQVVVTNCTVHSGCICHFGSFDRTLDAEVICCERNHASFPCRAVKYVLRDSLGALGEYSDDHNRAGAVTI